MDDPAPPVAPDVAIPSADISIVMPCLNEERTLAACVDKARAGLKSLGLAGEIVVADNGSVDGSVEIARRLGARVVHVAEKGYGRALRAGIQAARGRYIVMGDADDSYDFSAIEPFVARLREGFDLVMGNRFKGEIRPGAMPWKHRWIGNPVLTGLGRLFFRSPVGDFHCGLRAFTREAWLRMDPRSPGMEFASEMVIKGTLKGLRLAEVPIVLHKDGRSRPPHLRSWRDGWRHLKFMLLFSPLWLFAIPGLSLLAGGLASGLWLMGGPRKVGNVTFDVHTLLVSGFAAVIGLQLLVFAAFAKSFAVRRGLHPPNPRFARPPSLEFGVVTGLILGLAGVGFLAWALWTWTRVGFGPLAASVSMRQVIPAVTLMTLGAQILFGSFFLNVLGLVAEDASQE